MAGPWEQYQPTPAAAPGPWSEYQRAEEQEGSSPEIEYTYPREGSGEPTVEIKNEIPGQRQESAASYYGRAVTAPFAGVKRGFQDITDTALSLIAKGVDKVAGDDFMSRAIQAEIDRQKAQYEQQYGEFGGGDVGRIIGVRRRAKIFCHQNCWRGYYWRGFCRCGKPRRCGGGWNNWCGVAFNCHSYCGKSF